MGSSLDIQLQNRTESQEVYAYVTGLALEKQNHVCLMSSDGKTPYYPPSPAQTVSPLSEDCAIRLGPPGSTTTVTIPQIAGGRIWFSVGQKLTFFLNPGPAIVEPSVTNPSDANININWTFCEFTFANNSLYANISYVDFVSLPVSLSMTPEGGAEQKVLGLKADGLSSICAGLESNDLPSADDWKKSIYKSSGQALRVLSPNAATHLNGGGLFQNYYGPHVDAVWEKYSKAPLIVDTQAEWGKVTGQVRDGKLEFSGLGSFAKPSTEDIFTCSTGPFQSNVGALGPLTARISAALNRSTLLVNDAQPHGETLSNYYKESITNHYARLVHEANLDGRGYAFPYDDVSGGADVDQSGFVNGCPKAFIVTIG